MRVNFSGRSISSNGRGVVARGGPAPKCDRACGAAFATLWRVGRLCERDGPPVSSSTLYRFVQRDERQWAIVIHGGAIYRLVRARPRNWFWTSTRPMTRFKVAEQAGSPMGTTTPTAICRRTYFAVSSCWSSSFVPRTLTSRSTRGRCCRCWSNVFANLTFGSHCVSCWRQCAEPHCAGPTWRGRNARPFGCGCSTSARS